MKARAYDIEYDTDGFQVDLPTILTFEIPKDLKDDDEIEDFVSDEISNQTGYCHFGFDLIYIE